MKTISIWQPFALLLVRGFKHFETRTWPAPASLIGQTVGIASTRLIRPEQKVHFESAEFQEFYGRLNLPENLIDLPHGYLLGTVVLDSVELMTPEFMDDVSNEEKAYGWWQEGHYAWRTRHPEALDHPIPIRGAQGIYNWDGDLNAGRSEAYAARTGAVQVVGLP